MRDVKCRTRCFCGHKDPPQWRARCVSSRALLARGDSTLDYLHDRDSNFHLLFAHDVPRITGVDTHLLDHSLRLAYESSEHLQILGKYGSKSCTRVTSLVTSHHSSRRCECDYQASVSKVTKLSVRSWDGWGLPGGSVAKTLHSQHRGARFDPWSGIISCFLLLKDPTCCD